MLGFHGVGLKGYPEHLPHQPELSHVTTSHSSGVWEGPSVSIAMCSCTGCALPKGAALAQGHPFLVPAMYPLACSSPAIIHREGKHAEGGPIASQLRRRVPCLGCIRQFIWQETRV